MERNIGLDILRIIACIAVIMIHTAGSPICHNMVQPHTLWYNECLILDALCRFSVPVFAMITGYFMLEHSKPLSLQRLFCYHIIRIVIALIFWSVIYALILKKSIYPFGSQEGHFWYLGMLIGLYLSTPILRLIAQRQKLLKYFCITWLIIMCYKFAGNFVTLPFALDKVIFADYAGYCLFAYYLKQLPNLKRVLQFIGILGLVVTITGVLITQNGDSCFMGYTSPNVIAVSFALFYHFAYMGGAKRTTYRQQIQTAFQAVPDAHLEYT